MRMHIAAALLTLAVVVTTPLPLPAQTTGAGQADVPPSAWALFGGPVQWKTDAEMHRQFFERFRSAVGLGAARMTSPSLRVHEGMVLSLTERNDEDPLEPATLRYALKTLELVGIAKHATPAAFVAANHVDRAGAAKTRPLTRFEQQAIASLSGGGEVVAETTRAGRTVVGAIRAAAECTSCHPGSQVGTLLGAFSYRLERVSEKP